MCSRRRVGTWCVVCVVCCFDSTSTTHVTMVTGTEGSGAGTTSAQYGAAAPVARGGNATASATLTASQRNNRVPGQKGSQKKKKAAFVQIPTCQRKQPPNVQMTSPKGATNNPRGNVQQTRKAGSNSFSGHLVARQKLAIN